MNKNFGIILQVLASKVTDLTGQLRDNDDLDTELEEDSFWSDIIEFIEIFNRNIIQADSEDYDSSLISSDARFHANQSLKTLAALLDNSAADCQAFENAISTYNGQFKIRLKPIEPPRIEKFANIQLQHSYNILLNLDSISKEASVLNRDEIFVRMEKYSTLLEKSFSRLSDLCREAENSKVLKKDVVASIFHRAAEHFRNSAHAIEDCLNAYEEFYEKSHLWKEYVAMLNTEDMESGTSAD